MDNFEAEKQNVMDELKIIENLQRDIKSKIGRSLDAPADFDFLSMQIKLELNEYISPTTLKRFFNYISSNVKPRISTMSLLARFVGAAGWQDYCNNLIEGPVDKESEKIDPNTTRDEKVDDNIECHYSDIKKIHSSENGKCEIYRAKRFGRWHTLKALKEEYKDDASCREALYNEFNNVYMRTHPNLVRSVGYEMVDGLGECIVMEYVEGENIIDYIKNNNLSKSQVLSLIKELAIIIDFVHENGIIHNDIRRENVIVTYDGGHVKLVDFSQSTSNFYIKYKDYPDFYNCLELIKEISSNIKGGLPHIKRLFKRFEEAKKSQEIITVVELVETLNVKTSYMPFIFTFAIIFSAVLSSVLTSQIVQNNRPGRHVRDLKSTIVIFDTISKIVENHATKVCRNMYNNIDTISDKREKLVLYSKHHRALIKAKEVYPVKVLDKYIPKSSPEYNLYKSSLVQIVEDVYTKYYNFKLDSLRKAQ